TDHPLSVCASVGALQYDPGVRALEVRLAPQAPGAEPPNSTYILPTIVTVPAHRRAHLDANLPRVLTRVGGAPGGVSPVIERLPIHEATSVTIAVAWSDARWGGDARTWVKGVASFQITRIPSQP